MEIGLLTLPVSALVGCTTGAITGAYRSTEFALVGGCYGLAIGIACYFVAVFTYISLLTISGLLFKLRHGAYPDDPPLWYKLAFLPLMAAIVIASGVLSWWNIAHRLN